MKNEPDTLCWSCRYATGNPIDHKTHNDSEAPIRCPWVSEGKKIPEWSATAHTETGADGEPMTTYAVHKCPYYEPDLWAKTDALSPTVIAQILGVLVELVGRRLFLKLCKKVVYRIIKKLLKQADQPDENAFKYEDLIGSKNTADIVEHFGPIAEKVRRETILEMIENYEDEAADLTENGDSDESGMVAGGISDTKKDKKVVKSGQDENRVAIHLNEECKRLRTLLREIEHPKPPRKNSRHI